MALASLFLAAVATPDAALTRMAAYLQKPFTVSFQVTRERLPGAGTGTLTVQRPNRMNYRIQWLGDDYQVGWSENRTIEIVRNLKTYFESGPYPRLYMPESHISDVAKFGFPVVLLAGDPRSIYPNTQLKLVGQEKVQGITCDHVKGGTNEGFDVWIAPDGRPMRYRFDDSDPAGTVSVKYEFSKWASASNVPLATFEPPAPSGFRQHGLPRDPRPMQPGERFPTEGWLDASGQTAKLTFDKITIVVVTAADCEVTPRAANALRELESTAKVILLCDSGRAPATLNRYPVFRDKGQRTLTRLTTPGTPLFLLVGTDGVVRKTWLGFTRAQSAKFVQEMKEAAKDE